MLHPDPRSPIVVCAADNNYAMQLAVVARSAVENLEKNRHLFLFVIDGGITARNKAKILRSIDCDRCSLTWLETSAARLQEMPTSGHITTAAYLRLLIPDLLPLSIKKAIYLDSDLIVNADLGKLWDLPIQDYLLQAVQEFSIPYVSSPRGLVNYQALGRSPQDKYFNSGVLVLNLEQWRSQQLGKQIVDYIRTHKEFVRFHDQDGLNAVLAGQWEELDPRWNQTPEIYQFASWQESPFTRDVFDRTQQNPYIIHFATAAKPWNSREVYPANDLFFQYVDKTAWSGWRLTRWRRLWRRVHREIKQINKFTLSALTFRKPSSV